MPQIKVPAVLTDAGSTSTLEVEGETVDEVLANHAAEYGDSLRNSVVENGEIKEFMNVYVDGDEVTDLDAPVDDDSRIRVIPAASGGTSD